MPEEIITPPRQSIKFTNDAFLVIPSGVFYSIEMDLRRWTVSELIRYVRGVFETDYRLQDLEIEGEITNLRIPASGHVYFNLRDTTTQISCVMWASDRQAMTASPSDGARIIATGMVSIYEKTGQLQFYCRRIRMTGEGDLLYQFDKLKQLLYEEGVFDSDKKSQIPEGARRIAVITSETGAALQDALNVFERRRPFAEIFLYPVLVQGDGAPTQIMRALTRMNERSDVDLCLILRGGGASEDLWAFNDPDMARLISKSRVPVITGIGHEIDITLADFAADLRAATPTAAAELATPVTLNDLRGKLIVIQQRIDDLAREKILSAEYEADLMSERLQRVSPLRVLAGCHEQVVFVAGMLERSFQLSVLNLTAKVREAGAMMRNLDPRSVLQRGYAMVMTHEGSLVRNANQVNPDDHLKVVFSASSIDVKVEGRLIDENS